ncbi:uncharacterized protein LOC135850051 [Planococcus citri]|uniref:uncharacterized protein LOC135850051 n=1 Tax=Planococcus citri TaxID=170843 RepID=UPI0031F8AD77
MRLITTQFIFILLLVFVLDLCNAASKQSKSTMALKKYRSIHPNKFFKKECENEIKHFMSQRGVNKVDNLSSQECMLFCGFRRLGMIHYPGELSEIFVDNKIGPNKQEALKQIHMCTSAIKLGDQYFCSRAMKHLECAFEHIVGAEWMEDQMREMME